MRPRLHHIALRCTDLDRSLSFYAEGLGLGDPYLWNAPPLVSRAAFLEADGRTWLELFDGGGTPAPPGEDAGLFHFALSVTTSGLPSTARWRPARRWSRSR
jgi:catechol 2,3-dioxygenase-like lactoylglutathione lyase family enzyme